MKLKPRLPWRRQDIGGARPMEYLLRSSNRSGNRPRERNLLQSTNMKGIGDLKSALTSGTEKQSLEFVHIFTFVSYTQLFIVLFI